MGLTDKGKPRSLKTVIKNAKLLEFGGKENWPKNLESPVIDGDDEKFEGKDGYKGHWVIRASSAPDQRPSVVDKNGSLITEPADLYPGCYARAYVYAYVWSFMKRQGVGFALDHVEKRKEGKSFGGKKPVDQVFTPATMIEDDEDDSSDDDEDF
jgi:Protein of unknown function (DUF2815)